MIAGLGLVRGRMGRVRPAAGAGEAQGLGNGPAPLFHAHAERARQDSSAWRVLSDPGPLALCPGFAFEHHAHSGGRSHAAIITAITNASISPAYAIVVVIFRPTAAIV